MSGESMSKIVKVYFSPSNTTKKVVEQIASNFDDGSETYDLLNFNGEKEFPQDTIAIVGMPVFAGRIPKSGRERLEKLKGNNTKAIAIANYKAVELSTVEMLYVILCFLSSYDCMYFEELFANLTSPEKEPSMNEFLN